MYLQYGTSNYSNVGRSRRGGYSDMHLRQDTSMFNISPSSTNSQAWTGYDCSGEQSLLLFTPSTKLWKFVSFLQRTHEHNLMMTTNCVGTMKSPFK